MRNTLGSLFGFAAAASATAGSHLTKRDGHASTLEDLFDFDCSPSADVPVALPAEDCTPHPWYRGPEIRCAPCGSHESPYISA